MLLLHTQAQLVFTDCTFAAATVHAAWDKYFMGTPFAASLASLEKQGHTGATAQAREVYEKLAEERGFIGKDGSFRYCVYACARYAMLLVA